MPLTIRSVEERLARLEERVLVGQTRELEEERSQLEKMSIEVKALTNRLNYLILILVGNFGLAFVKAVPAVINLLS